jgi:protocatechuate 3,4-dioxygenase beta subunit
MEAATHRLEYAAQPERFFWSCPETSRVEGLSGAGAVQHDIALISAEPWPTTTVEGHVLDSDGKPIAGAEVAGFDGTKQVTTTSGADGAFSLAGVAIDDEYVEVGASHPEFVPFAQPAAAKAGETVCGVEFKLPRRPRVHGKVTDGSGETVAGARVFVIDEDVPGRCVFGAGPSGPRFQLVQMTTDAAGAYSAFIDLGHGLLTVHAEAAGITAASARVEEAQDRRDYAMDVVLPVRVSIVGRIAAKASAEGVSGVPVAVVREPWTESDHADDLRDKTIVVRSVTAANGDFRIDGVAPGRWLVVAGDAMSTSARAVCDVPNKDPLVLVVEPALMLRGTVEFTEGGPAAGVKVSVWPGPRRGVGTDQIGDDRVTGADGRFVVRGLVKGAYWLDLDVGEPSIQEAYVGPFDAGKPVPPIRVKRGLVLAGRVVDAGGNGVEKAAVFADAAEEESPRPRGMQYTAEDGSFRLAGLDEGPYVVRVRAAGFLLRAKTDVKAGGEALVVTMDRGLAIEGVVIDADGRLVEGLRFDASPVGHAGDEQNAESDEHGRFRITGLTPGRWKLSANQWRGQGDETAPPFPAALVVEAGTKDVRLECPRRTKDASGDK